MSLSIAFLLSILIQRIRKKKIKVQHSLKTSSTKMSLRRRLNFELNCKLIRKFIKKDMKFKNPYLKTRKFLTKNLTLIWFLKEKAHYAVELSSTLHLQCITLGVKREQDNIRQSHLKMDKIKETKAHTCLQVLM